jgi:structural maintenance of chromosome 1
MLIVIYNVLHLVVTVDGILLTKSGTMTGGTSGGMEARSNKWDDSAIECLYYAIPLLHIKICVLFGNVLLALLAIYITALKKNKNKLETEMSELGSPRELQRKELAISEKITGLEKKLHYSNVEQVGLTNKPDND